jgi:hypothetical protein
MARRRLNRGTKDRIGGASLIVLGLVLLSALVGSSWWVKSTKIATDKTTNCPVVGPRAIHAIMIDQSDRISGQQAQQIREYLTRAKREASFGTRFDIYTFEGNTADELAPKASVCAPGKPEDANEIYENPEFVRKNYDESFSKVVDGAIEMLLRTDTLSKSPVIESIRAASITSFSGTDLAAERLRVTLISDMIQNSDQFSQFRGIEDFEHFSKKYAWVGMRPQLKGAEVRILYLWRPAAVRGGKPIQDRGHQAFWEQLITASGGVVQSIQPL